MFRPLRFRRHIMNEHVYEKTSAKAARCTGFAQSTRLLITPKRSHYFKSHFNHNWYRHRTTSRTGKTRRSHNASWRAHRPLTPCTASLRCSNTPLWRYFVCCRFAVVRFRRVRVKYPIVGVQTHVGLGLCEIYTHVGFKVRVEYPVVRFGRRWARGVVRFGTESKPHNGISAKIQSSRHWWRWCGPEEKASCRAVGVDNPALQSERV